VHDRVVSKRLPTVNLRLLKLDDAEVIASWATDPEFCRAADWTAAKQLSAHMLFHQHLIASPPADLIRLGVLAEGTLIGYVDLHGNESDRRELGFVIGGRANWQRGLGLAAVDAGLRFGFEQLGLDEIWAEALDANQASVRILQRIAMHETGTGTSGTYLGVPTRFRQFAIARRAWSQALAPNRTHM
jgi:RimJ/RimL family protein N-acetyltransferase